MSEEAEVLFTITTNHLNSGLRGYPVGTCRTSAVHPDTGVAYVGYPINKLADLDPEAVAFLLLERRLPTEEEIASFKADLRARSGIDPKVLELLRGLPREGHPMEWLISGLVFVGMTSKTGDYVEDARNVIAWAPELVAAIFRLRHGWGDPIPARPELGLVENFVHMLGVPGVDEAKLTRLLRTFYVLHMDHGGGNLSTFTGKAVASGAADMYAS
ncbi:MAG: citrate synthase, partial [Myxococcota bacterium]